MSSHYHSGLAASINGHLDMALEAYPLAFNFADKHKTCQFQHISPFLTHFVVCKEAVFVMEK